MPKPNKSTNFYRYECIECKEPIMTRRRHLWDEDKKGHRCPRCWDAMMEKEKELK